MLPLIAALGAETLDNLGGPFGAGLLAEHLAERFPQLPPKLGAALLPAFGAALLAHLLQNLGAPFGTPPFEDLRLATRFPQRPLALPFAILLTIPLDLLRARPQRPIQQHHGYADRPLAERPLASMYGGGSSNGVPSRRAASMRSYQAIVLRAPSSRP